MIRALLKIIEKFLSTESSLDDYVFFDDLEYLIYCSYDNFAVEDPRLSKFLYNQVMKICQDVTYKCDCLEQREALRATYERLNFYLNFKASA